METKQKRTKVKVSVLALALFMLCINGLAGSYCQAVTLEYLSQIINDLPDDVLSDEVKKSLVTKVENALKSVDKEKDDVAVKMLGAFINEIEALRGKKISEDTADMLVETANNIIDEIKIGVSVSIVFKNEFGICIAASDGTTFIFGGMIFTDPFLIYDEAYWGVYPLYMPGTDAQINIGVTYNGADPQADIRIITEAYVLETDGSTGIQVKEPMTYDRVLNSGECLWLDGSFTLPIIPKGLQRFIVTIQRDGMSLTKEAIYCPPDIAQ